MLNGVFWVLRTGAPWHDLPSRYPPYQTCHRRFQHWQRSGLLTRLLQKLAEDLRDREEARCERILHRRQFQRREKGGSVSALQSAAKAAKSWQSRTAMVFPFAVHVAASPHETKLVEPTLEHRFLKQTPERMIGDPHMTAILWTSASRNATACAHRASQGICARVAPQLQEAGAACIDVAAVGRSSVCSWLHNFRRTVIRWEYYPRRNFLGMVQLACSYPPEAFMRWLLVINEFTRQATHAGSIATSYR